jgi:AcrR family transcriptional regulator
MGNVSTFASRVGGAKARARARKLPGAVRREQILDAALTMFARAGYRDVPTAAVAGALGVSEPTLFRHFPTKRALYLATIDRSAEMVIGHWRQIAEHSGSALDALVEMGRWYFAELQNDSRHLRLRFRSSTEGSDPEIVARVRQHFRTVFDLVHGLFERARAAGEIAADTDTRAHAWLFTAIGTLLDVTQILGVRDDLPLEAMPAVMALIAPKRGTGVPTEIA